MTLRLEHANLCVRDIAAMVRFLGAAFPDFGIRHDATGDDGVRWVHVGTNETYIALSQATAEPASRWAPYEGIPGVNHLGFEVDDVNALSGRLHAGGYKPSAVADAHPHRKRAYFFDSEGNDWEFVEYLSDDPAERHDYALPDR